MEPKTKSPHLERMKMQARRITAMQELQACMANKKDKTPRWRGERRKQTKNTIEKFIRDTGIGNAKETLDELRESRGNRNMQRVIATKNRMDYDRIIKEMERNLLNK